MKLVGLGEQLEDMAEFDPAEFTRALLARSLTGTSPLKDLAMTYAYSDLSKMIDHSLLVPTMNVEQLEEGCQLALAYDVASVCIMPYYLKRCAQILAGSTVMPSTTIGFPHGGHTTRIKQREANKRSLMVAKNWIW